VNELLSKLSSYHIFNHLFPGAVFCIVAEHLSIMPSPSELIKQIFWYYFVGVVVSRVGSAVVEPVLKWLSFVPTGKYSAYLHARELDEKLELMVEVLNTYRTLATTFLMLLFGIVLSWLSGAVGVDAVWRERCVLVALFILFLFSFRKQAKYIEGRITHQKDFRE
jgi:hypothetical protein